MIGSAATPIAPLLDAGRIGLVVIDRQQRIGERQGRMVEWLVTGTSATEALPFLVGYEPILAAIAAGRRSSLHLPRLAWQNGPLGDRVVAVEALRGPATGAVLLWLQDATILARLEQQVLQQRNELTFANAALVEARARAELAHRAKSAFLANVSHDLQSPLQVIIGNAEILATATAGAEQQALLRDIRDNGQFLLTLITDLLEVAALESGRLEPAEEPVDLAGLIERTIAAVRSRPGSDRRAIEHRSSGSAPLILGDPTGLQRLLMNLLANAVKFTADQGRITIDVAPDSDGTVVVTIADDGRGIDPALLPRIFEPFVGHGEGAGSGLGLYVAKEIAEQHDATLSLHSALGEGTTARLVLPASRMIEPGR